MLNKRIKKVISSILISLAIITAGGYKAVGAANYPTSISQTEFDKLKKMTLEELKAIAKPMPESNIAVSTEQFGTLKTIKFVSPLYKDENIYYIQNNLFGKEYLGYYKFTHVKPWVEDKDTVEYHAIMWDFVNGELKKVVDFNSNEANKELHDKLVPKQNQNNDNSNNTIPNTNNNNNANKNYTKKRIYGLTRIDTAKAVAEEFNDGMVQNIIITSGLNYPDALSGSVLAKKLNAPILLVGLTPIESASAINYIKEHLSKDGTIYILGGQGAVNESFVATFKALGFNNIERLWGIGRYDTNKAINETINVEKGVPVVIASGEGFADALSISSIASAKGYPIVLTPKNNLTEQGKETLKNINPSKVYIIGGTGSISENVKNEIKNIVGISENDITRLWGANRYLTSLNIAKHFNLEGDTVTFASGKNFPDALAGSILSAKYNSPLILVGDDAIDQRKYVDSTNYIKQIFFGGPGSINPKIEEYLSK